MTARLYWLNAGADQPPRVYWLDAGSDIIVTGLSSATLAAFTGSATGVVGNAPVLGASSASIGAVTGAASGTVRVAGASAGTLGEVSGQAAGAVEVRGASAAALEAVTGVATGSALPTRVGQSAQVLTAVTGSATGVVAQPSTFIAGNRDRWLVLARARVVRVHNTGWPQMTGALVKRSAETKLFDIDCSAILSASETITTVPQVLADEAAGPALTFGIASVNDEPITYAETRRTVAARKVVQVLIGGGAEGLYTVRARFNTSNAGELLEAAVFLRVTDRP